MPVITIPFDYDEKLHSSVVPICISDTDLEGNVIHTDWFELGVAPVADPAQADTVVQVVRAGYRLGDRVLRPARVLVGRYVP